MSEPLPERIREATGVGVRSLRPVGGGCVADLRQADLVDGTRLAVKSGSAGLDIEARMLGDLAQHGLPVPRVIAASRDLLAMEWIDNDGRCDAETEEHAADLIAALHDTEAAYFGYAYDTLIGGLAQPNPKSDDWPTFFAEHRLRAMAAEAHRAGRLPLRERGRIEALAERLDRWMGPAQSPSLIHGDLWSGNVLCRSGRIAAFIDPAIYYADAEIELAFVTLFGSFGSRFFARYAEHRPLGPDFFDCRRDLYNLYPLLVHARLFGGHYVNRIATTLDRFGC